ncbi:hypothetical protein NKDENANG_01236 [Candidatus Entotheonellaceae bacterium PAL068K]
MASGMISRRRLRPQAIYTTEGDLFPLGTASHTLRAFFRPWAACTRGRHHVTHTQRKPSDIKPRRYGNRNPPGARADSDGNPGSATATRSVLLGPTPIQVGGGADAADGEPLLVQARRRRGFCIIGGRVNRIRLGARRQ